MCRPNKTLGSLLRNCWVEKGGEEREGGGREGRAKGKQGERRR